MGKNRNKNNSKKSNNVLDAYYPPMPDTSHSASSVTTSSTIDVVGDASCPSRRTFDGTVGLPIRSDSSPVELENQLRSSDKRDSVISSDWMGQNDEPQRSLKATSQGSWRWKPRRWWPCRAYRRTSELVFALGRAYRGPGWRDWVLTLCLAVTVIFCSYIALELFLSMLKFATAADADCSIVYVTVPGPIVTVSLINPSPSNPARSTYLFSVVNGTTEWMNSVAPPSRFGTLTTKASDTASIISSLPASSAFSISSLWLTGAPTLLVSLPSYAPPLSTTTFTTMYLSGNTLFTTMTISMSSGSDTVATQSTSSVPSSFPRSPLSTSSRSATSNTTITVISIAPGGQRTTLTRITATTSGGLLLGTSSYPSQLATSRIPITPTSTPPTGVTSTLTIASTTVFGWPPPGALPSLVRPTRLNSIATLSSSISIVSITAATESSTFINNLTSAAIASSLGSSLTSSIWTRLTSTLSGGSTISITSTSTTVIGLSSPGTVPTPAMPSTSNVVTTHISNLLGGLTTTPTMFSMTTFSATTLLATLLSHSMPFGSSSLLYSSLPSVSQSERFTVSLPKPPTGSSSPAITTLPSVITSTATQVVSGPTTTITLISRVSLPVTVSLFSLSSIGTSPSSAVTQVPSFLSSSSSMFSWPLPSAPLVSGSGRPAAPSKATSSSPTPLSSDSTTGSPSSGAISLSTRTTFPSSPLTYVTSLAGSSAPNFELSLYTSSSRPLVSLTFSLSVLSITSSYPNSSLGSPTLLPSSTMFTTSAPPLSSPSGALNQTTSTLIFISVSSFRLSSRTFSDTNPTNLVSTLAPPLNVSSSSSRLISSSSSSSSSDFPRESSFGLISTSLLDLSATSLDVFSDSVSSSSIPGYMSIQTDTRTEGSFVASTTSGQEPTTPSTAIIPDITVTSTPLGSDGTSVVKVQDLTTKIISFGDTAWSFVFPTPSIITTVSYWTGVYPTMTGSMPSELQGVPPTTRSVRQTPLSAVPSFDRLSSRAGSFNTVVTTMYDDGGTVGRNLKRAADPPVAPTLATTAVPDLTRTGADMSAVEAPGPTSCGESGNFTLNFDDTVAGSNEDQILAVNGLANPYHHLFYANGYTYVPDKWEPYPAISQPNIAMFLPLTGRLLPNQPFAGTLLPGEVGAGPRASVSAYWFNAYSGYFGCALNGVSSCLLRISGYRYDAVLKEEVLVVEQNATLAACWGYIDCRLTQVMFSDEFQALSGIQFNAYTAGLGIPQVHMMDDLRMAWYNNSCSAGIQRIGHR